MIPEIHTKSDRTSTWPVTLAASQGLLSTELTHRAHVNTDSDGQVPFLFSSSENSMSVVQTYTALPMLISTCTVWPLCPAPIARSQPLNHLMGHLLAGWSSWKFAAECTHTRHTTQPGKDTETQLPAAGIRHQAVTYSPAPTTSVEPSITSLPPVPQQWVWEHTLLLPWRWKEKVPLAPASAAKAPVAPGATTRAHRPTLLAWLPDLALNSVAYTQVISPGAVTCTCVHGREYKNKQRVVKRCNEKNKDKIGQTVQASVRQAYWLPCFTQNCPFFPFLILHFSYSFSSFFCMPQRVCRAVQFEHLPSSGSLAHIFSAAKSRLSGSRPLVW